MPTILTDVQPLLSMPLEHARQQLVDHGCCLVPPLIPSALIARAVERMDAVIDGEYATGVAPFRTEMGEGRGLRKIDQVHLTDPVLREVCTHPEIGRWAAALLGAASIQLWAVQMLFKPTGGDAAGRIGFHQDRWYWRYWTPESEVFTAWIALSDVTADSGPMRFVPGSHRWGEIADQASFDQSKSSPQEIQGLPAGEPLRESAAIMPPGGVSFHHRLTLHGSGPNHAPLPRRALALHLRTERSRPESGASDYYVAHLGDPDFCPMLHGPSLR